MSRKKRNEKIRIETLDVGIINSRKINYPLSFIKMKQLSTFLGPAFVVSVAYIDPGNFATNISGGSSYNYQLIWVVLWSNLMAIFLQSMSAKLGIATGCTLPQMCSKVFAKPANWVFFIVAELGAIATDLAEFLGGTLGLYILFHIPMIYAGFITAFITFLIVYSEKYGQKVVEVIISILISIICVAYTLEVFLSKPEWDLVAFHTIVPMLPDEKAVLIAVGMLGATVMPHVLYLHSHLVQSRRNDESEEEKHKHLRMEKIDICIAMNIAFIVNASMIIVSAAVFHKNGIHVDTIEQAHQSLQPLLGSLSSGAFGIALLASGLSSTAVGTMAGQIIMDGFVNLKLPINVRRLLTMGPALLVIILGINPMNVLILSQVALSFILPFPIFQLLIITNRKDLMGAYVNKRYTKVIGMVIAALIILLNIALIYLTLTGKS